MSSRSSLSALMFLVVILLGFVSQTVSVHSARPPFVDQRNDVLDENGRQTVAEPYLDIVLVDVKESDADYVIELGLDGPLPQTIDPSLWIDWGIMINTDKTAATGWGGGYYNNIGADLFVRLGMQKSDRFPQFCQLGTYPQLRVTDERAQRPPQCAAEGSRIIFTVNRAIGLLFESCPWIAVARKSDQSDQKERLVAIDKAPNEGYYTISAETTRTFTQRTISVAPPVNWTIIDSVSNIDWNSAARIVAGGLTWESISTKYFTLYYNTSRDQSTKEAVARVDNLYTFMRTYSGVDVVVPIQIWLCYSQEELERVVQHITGTRQYYTAVSFVQKSAIVIDISNTLRRNWTGVTSDYGAYLGITLHELAHFFISQKSQLNYYSWGNEMFCTYFHWKVYAYYGSNRYLQPLATVTKLQLTMPFAQIGEEGMLKQYPELFNVGASVLFYLSDAWGDDGVKVFWNTLVYSTWKEAFEKTFGQPVDELEREWSRYYQESWPDIAIPELSIARQKLSRWQAMENPHNHVLQNATIELQRAEYNKRIWNFGTAYGCAARAISVLDPEYKLLASKYIDLAKAEIERARLEKRTIGLEQAEVDLQRSQQLLQQVRYEEAYTLASRAVSIARSGKVPATLAMAFDTYTYVVLLIAAAVIVMVLIRKRRKKPSN